MPNAFRRSDLPDFRSSHQLLRKIKLIKVLRKQGGGSKEKGKNSAWWLDYQLPKFLSAISAFRDKTQPLAVG
jgi:hypothetical protein